MQINVRVSSLVHAVRLSHNWADLTISLLDPNMREPPILGNVCTYFFEDSSLEGVGPSEEIIAEILARVGSHSNVLVHCHAGISRSPAVAIGILIASGVSPREAIRQIFSQNLIDNEGSYMEPNELILSHIDHLLGLNGELIPMVREEM